MGWGVVKIDLDKLQNLYNEGLTYEQLASSFNVTKGAVSFQLQKLKRQGKIKPRAVTLKPQKRDRLPNTVINNTLSWRSFKSYPMPNWDYVSETGKTLLDLKANECRWPCKDGLFCGKISAMGKSYCEEHQRKSEGR